MIAQTRNWTNGATMIIDVRVAKGTGLSESSPAIPACRQAGLGNPPQTDCIGKTKINRLLALWILVVFAGATVGCDVHNKSGKRGLSLSSDNDSSDWEFQQGADRPPTYMTLYSMAKLLAAQGREAQCRMVLLRIVQEYPEFMPAYCDLAELHMRLDEPDNAIHTLNTALKVSPEDPVLLNNLGVCWVMQGKYDKALASFTEAAGISPNDARYRANMAVALGMMGRDSEAFSLLEHVLSPPDANHNLKVVQEARSASSSLPFRKDAATIAGN